MDPSSIAHRSSFFKQARGNVEPSPRDVSVALALSLEVTLRLGNGLSRRNDGQPTLPNLEVELSFNVRTREERGRRGWPRPAVREGDVTVHAGPAASKYGQKLTTISGDSARKATRSKMLPSSDLKSNFLDVLYHAVPRSTICASSNNYLSKWSRHFSG